MNTSSQGLAFLQQTLAFAKEIVTFLNTLAPHDDVFILESNHERFITSLGTFYCSIQNKSNSFMFSIEAADSSPWKISILQYLHPKNKKSVFTISKNETYTQKEFEKTKNEILTFLKKDYTTYYKAPYIQAFQQNFKKDVENLVRDIIMKLNTLARNSEQFTIERKFSDIYELYEITSDATQFRILLTAFKFRLSDSSHELLRDEQGWSIDLNIHTPDIQETKPSLLDKYLNPLRKYGPSKKAQYSFIISKNETYTTKEMKRIRDEILTLVAQSYKN